MNYREAIHYLKNLTKFGINFGLGRIVELLRRLDNPHLKLKTIHVGGTNGKGSTTAMIAGILQAAGYTTGTFTSPHLHRYNERFRINGKDIADRQISRLINTLKPHLDAMVAQGYEHPTEFEVSTAMACLYFYRQGVDFAIFEVGLGGEIDSTNVIKPLVAVITNVSIDHRDYLGSTVGEIAKVKAGIIKGGAPVVTAATEPEALAVIKGACTAKEVPLIQVGRQVAWKDKSILGRHRTYRNIHLPLWGVHQQTNAATAVAAVEVLIDRGVAINPEAVRTGLSNVSWPGRFEIIAGSPDIVLDGAHNPAGARALAEALKSKFPHRPIIMVLGMLADKERQQIINILAPLAKGMVVTAPNNPRAGDWQQVAQWAREHLPDVRICPQIPEAIKTALAMASPQDLVCITGSLYMIAEAREAILINKNSYPYQ
ncbi:bifunctional folylpolyglutamate synthase/dihydrofolate synthase [Desulfofalx alkaliphila]|uniref:bifunctional folylpolyglutamate synthase/dihydrofolate synthase n=1 Tax=Desulfofalx alkaliphila TaxID=105483 RepID=UPI0004E0B06A|nr:folylpolyglutamate synthase/dihydrofolate synthase family protein [Desulfofalx alkaliphila]